MKLDTIKKQLDTQYQQMLFDAFASELHVESVKIVKSKSYSLQFDIYVYKYRITVDIDRYNNLNCKFHGKERIPLFELSCFSRVLTEYIEKKYNLSEGYKKRTSTHLYFEYYKHFYDKISLDEIKQMLKIKGEGDELCFREWLLGDSYCHGGNFIENKNYKREDLK